MGLSLQQINTPDTLQVINLSTHTLTEHQIKALKHGLSFAPSCKFNLFNWIKDLNLFGRKLLLHKYFSKDNKQAQWSSDELRALQDLYSLLEDNETFRLEEKGPFTKLKPKSKFTPQNTICTKVEVFLEGCAHDLKLLHNKLQHKPQAQNNLSWKERQGLMELQKN